jgi:hypothetical protein
MRSEDIAEHVAAMLGHNFKTPYKDNRNWRSQWQQQPQGPQRSRHNSGNRNDNQGNSSTGGVICYYHMKFGPSAFKCASPCNFKALQAKFVKKDPPPKNERPLVGE